MAPPMGVRDRLERPLLRYYWGYDENDMEMMADAFTEDAVHVITANVLSKDHDDSPEKVRNGRAQIVAELSTSRNDFGARGEVPRHVVANFLVDEVGPELARVRSYYMLYVQSAVEGTVLIGTSTQYDELADEGDAWRIRHHRLVNAHTGGYDRLAQGRLERYR